MASPRPTVKQPHARRSHAAVSEEQNMLIWGGENRDGSLKTSTLEIFDVLSVVWQDPQQFRGQPLYDGHRGMAVASDGEKAYMFGGVTGPFGSQTCCNTLYQFDLTSMECTILEPSTTAVSPSAAEGSRMVCANRKLVLYGGFTYANLPSDELFTFDLDTNTWTSQATTGEKPPALCDHTFTMIDQYRAVLFGGIDQSKNYNDTFLLDINAWHWTKVQSTGTIPTARSTHAACCLGYTLTGQHSSLIIVGGWSGSTVLSDVWLLDVTNWSWSEVTLPSEISHRMGHSVVVFGYGPDFRVAVLFGGSKTYSLGDEISDTTLLLMSQSSGSWVVDRVVILEEMGTPDDILKEQIKRLQLFQPLSDERAQEIIDQALEASSLKMRNVVAVITGLTGAGKTWLLSRIFNKPPPGLYSSTGVAEQSFRGLLHHVGNMAVGSWQPFSHKDILEFLASLFRVGMPVGNVTTLATTPMTICSSTSVSGNPIPQPQSSTSSTTVSPLSASPVSVTTHFPTQKSTTSQALVGLVQAPKSSQRRNMLELVHMIDTGGQPEYIENMSTLIHSAHLALLVLNLKFGLDEYPPISFHVEGKSYKRALPSQNTNRQIIQKLACTLQAKRFSHEMRRRFRLLVVATHKDCVESNLSVRLEALEREVRGILLPACKEELILYSSSGKIIFALNLRDPDGDDENTLECIREKISESDVGEIIEVPGSFLVFEQDLLKYAENVKREILSFNECIQVGEKLKMKREVVIAALIFFHRQITFLFFQHILPDVIFTNPQIPLDLINAVVKFSYQATAGIFNAFPERFISNLNDGIITEEMLSDERLKKCFISKIYEPHHAIELFLHTFTIAPLSHEKQQPSIDETPQPKRKKRELAITSNPRRKDYLMMSLLPAVPDYEVIKHLEMNTLVAPLVIKFTKDCVPLSCFSSTISCLLSLYDWRLCREENGTPECLSHNIVSLYDPRFPVQITLIDVGHSFSVHVHAEKDTNHNDFPEICYQLNETVFSAIREVLRVMQLTEIEVSPAFICPCKEAPQVHSADTHFFRSNCFLRCSQTEMSVGEANWKHTVWLESPLTERSKPSLPKLLQLEIPMKIGAHYRNFGIFLLNDEDGNRVDAMELECLGKCQRIVQKILQEWIAGNGGPTTWKTLIKTLHDCEFHVLADQIRKHIK